MSDPQNLSRKQRVKNALWGLFIGDALAMPAHWYYKVSNIPKYFNGPVSKYEDPPHPHVESFMVGTKYSPDTGSAKRFGRKYDILHEHVRFYDTTYNKFSTHRSQQETEHGNAVPETNGRYHYHYGLNAGDNTRNAQLIRVLMRSLASLGKYDPDKFLVDFVDFLTTPGNCNDPYTEEYLRAWFENYSIGLPPRSCAEFQRNNWSVGSHGGMIGPMVLSMLYENSGKAQGFALQHQNLTHRSENVSTALTVVLPMLADLLDGKDPMDTLKKYSGSIRLPEITGEELFKKYRQHNGPGNIPKDEMWKLHTTYRAEPWDIESFSKRYDVDEVVVNKLATACYPEHGLPLLLFLAFKNDFDFRKALLANVNAGGDNVHRGMVMGLLLGAAASSIPDDLISGLTAHEELKNEIEAFAELIIKD